MFTCAKGGWFGGTERERERERGGGGSLGGGEGANHVGWLPVKSIIGTENSSLNQWLLTSSV